ncbi:MAG: universal stress protein [Sulfuricaulis sp.]|nr:universal stress protein [Sulfuricaulis sp.]
MTTTIKQILVATDLSPRADRALTRAVQLAKAHAAALTVMHVVEPVRPVPVDAVSWPPEALPAELEAQATGSARREIQRRLTELGLPEAGMEIRRGVPFLEIIQEARAENVEWVVLGAHGRAFLNELLLGTTAERVVRKGQLPALVVKNPAREMYRRVLVPTDFSATSKRALLAVTRLAPAARFLLLHVYDLSFELRAAEIGSERLLALQQEYEPGLRMKLKEFAAAAGLDPGVVELEVRYGYPGQVISIAARERQADLVAVGTSGLSDMRYVLLGSVAEHVLREAPSDVLTVPPSARAFELP